MVFDHKNHCWDCSTKYVEDRKKTNLVAPHAVFDLWGPKVSKFDHFLLKSAFWGLFWVQKSYIYLFSWFMPWFSWFMPREMLPKVHWSHFKAQKIMILGSGKPFRCQKYPILGIFRKSTVWGFFCLLNTFMNPFSWFMSWELLPEVHWIIFWTRKIIFLGSGKPFRCENTQFCVIFS